MTQPSEPAATQKSQGQSPAAPRTVVDQHAQTQVGADGAASQSPSEPEAKKSTRLGDFVLRKKLGQGGMGTVYLAHQVSLDRECAVKVLSKELAAKPGFVERFLREARAMARLNHPHIVACYAVGEEQGHHYVAMELMEGKSMQDWIEALGKVQVPDAVLVTLVAAEALQYAHGLKMIHRDIKPDNILVTHKGVVKVADLGLAKATDEDLSMTQSGTGLGTPHYMPPEQARNAKHVDHRCDIYALGCTLYHMLTGALPFAGETILELITNKEQGKFKPARRINGAVPEKLDLMIDKAMMKEPQHRYQSMQDFIRDLESLGIAGESLSFIEQPDKAEAPRGSGASSTRTAAAIKPGPTRATGKGTSAPQPVTFPSSAADANRQTLGDPQQEWYVKRVDSGGRIKVGKMTAAQVMAGLKSDQLGPQTQVARTGKGPFLPIAQIPVFEDETKKMLTRAKMSHRDQSLAAAYEQIDKQYQRLKWWRLLARFRDGTLGLVGFVLYLAVIAGVIGGLVWLVPQGWEFVAKHFNLK